MENLKRVCAHVRNSFYFDKESMIFLYSRIYRITLISSKVNVYLPVFIFISHVSLLIHIV